jgi:acyl-coenzyme A synthetase/AMP-(fatty) acid ligase
MGSPKDGALERPQQFNFATDVIDKWTSSDPEKEAMLWVSQDMSFQRSLSFQHFSSQSHRIATLLSGLGVRQGEVMMMMLHRSPAW